jgi:hypothetical protein
LVDVLEIEVILANVYKRKTSFFAIEKFLESTGYRLIALSPDGRFSSGLPFDIITNPELQFDAIYISNEIFKKITELGIRKNF